VRISLNENIIRRNFTLRKTPEKIKIPLKKGINKVIATSLDGAKGKLAPYSPSPQHGSRDRSIHLMRP
jgi:hypothetical protein